jgi:methylmalonyl-CoA mutase N-terminal domain/subunit
MEIERGERIVVGVNRFQDPEENLDIEILKIDPEVERRQRERLARLRAERSAAEVERTLEALKEGARGDANLMPLIIDCARAYCTEGEIIGPSRRSSGNTGKSPSTRVGPGSDPPPDFRQEVR